MSATLFYSSHILPSRPSHLSSLTSTPVNIKHSTYKSLTAFLKACEKEGLIKLKDTKSELVITGVFPNHADVLAHRRYETLKDVELKREKRAEMEEAEKNKVKEMLITEMWKPHQQTIGFFQETGNKCFPQHFHSPFQLTRKFCSAFLCCIHIKRFVPLSMNTSPSKDLSTPGNRNTSMSMHF
jgi:hypothetical protein